MLLTVLLFLAILSVLVFVHELGHFVAAKKMGVKVEEFGFGFPPKVWGVKRGDTVYSVNWIPVGGFVRLKGESGAHRGEADSFSSKKPWQRLVILVAGVAMNFLTAAALLGIGFMLGMPSMLGGSLPAGATVRDTMVRVEIIAPASPADRAGIKPGDTIVSLDGHAFGDETSMRAYIRTHGDAGMDARLRASDGSERQVRLVAEDLKNAQGVHGVGVGLVAIGLVTFPAHRAVLQGFVAAANMTAAVVSAFGDLLRSLVVEHKVSADLSGPVGIAVMTGEVAHMGLVYVLQFMAVISINLAVVNILPFPALDGGRILFLVVEKLRRKAMNAKTEMLANHIGFLALILLVLFITLRDVVKLLT